MSQVQWEQVDVEALGSNNLWVVFGHEFSGKSYFACTFPEPIYYISAAPGGGRAWQHFPNKDIRRVVIPPLEVKKEKIETRSKKMMDVWAVDQDTARERCSLMMEYWKDGVAQRSGTLVMDNGRSAYDLIRGAEFGKMSGVPQKEYGAINAQLEAMLAMAHKENGCQMNVVWIEELAEKWTKIKKADGSEDRAWDGESYEQKGYKGSNWKADVVVETLRDIENGAWGIQIKHKCAPAATLCGMELWGEDARYESLMELVEAEAERLQVK